MFGNIKAIVKGRLGARRYPFLEKGTIELNNLAELKKAFQWRLDPILDRPDIHKYEYIEDANERRIRDAESLATVMRNADPKVALEIGTAGGEGTLLMSLNAPSAVINTVNILPEEIEAGKGGVHTTIAMAKERIGAAYKERGVTNVRQIFANTATWTPDIGTIDVAFIDGCHDTDFVINDTKKILAHMRPGSFILWHDFNPSLASKFDWIHSVCLGVEKLLRAGVLKNRVFHLKDSWVGIYRV